MWRLTLTSVVAAVLLSAVSQGAWDPNSDPALVGWWKLNETSGTVAADSSGHGNDGTLNGNPTWVPGYFAGALEFDGTGDYVDCGGDPSVNFAGSVTVTAWIKLGEIGADRKIAGNQDGTAGGYKFGYYTNGKVEFEIRNATGGATLNRDTAGGTVLETDVWYHVAGVYQQGQYIRTYVNGALDREMFTGEVVGASQGTLKLGREPFNTISYWLGAMDDVRVYSRALTAAEVKALIPPKLKAYNPDPADGETDVLTLKMLSWTKGETAVLHDIYLGTDPEMLIKQVNPLGANRTMFMVFAGLEAGTTYYWRVDERDSKQNVYKGDVWSFTTIPLTAVRPVPRDGDKWISVDADLSWEPGTGALEHDVYFSTDEAAVTARDASALKSQAQLEIAYDPGTLLPKTTYYWAIDEISDQTYAGEVWKFTTEGGSVGVKGEYFNDRTLEGVPPLTRVDPEINFSWGDGGPGAPIGTDNFAVRWTADLEILFPDTFTFITTTDDGARLWVNDQRIINSWVDQGTTDRLSLPIRLEPGVYQLRMEYYENGGGAVAQLSWQTPTLARQIIPAGPLQPPFRARNPDPQNGDVNIPQDVTLRWSAGDSAVAHEVYFGDDEAAVAAATHADAGIYMGSKALDDMRFTPSLLDLNKTYYWRVDEVNNAEADSPWKGSVWSFTTADFIWVDDFESYTEDYENLGCVYQTWVDGTGFTTPVDMPGNGSGASVGHPTWDPMSAYYNTTTVETAITVPGSDQSMPLYYNNGDPAKKYYSEAIRTWTMPQDWTRDGVTDLTLWVHGFPEVPQSVVVTESPATKGMTLTSDGSDIWNNSDEFTFAYKTLNGDGTMVARVVSNGTGTSTWTKGGVMIRQSLDGSSTHAMMIVTAGGGNGANFQWRQTSRGGSANTDPTSAVTPPYWVKIERFGDTLSGSIAPDGVSWAVVGTVQIPMTGPAYIGLCTSSGVADVDRTFEFDNIQSTGAVAGQWQGAIIDGPLYGNRPAKMYVTLTDSLGKSRTVPDPNTVRVNTGAWTQWKIPLSDLNNVDATRIKKMAIGVDNRDNPGAGGAGIVFIDDICVIKPEAQTAGQ